MSKFSFFPTPRYLKQADILSEPIYSKLQKCLLLLEENPYHPSLRTHKVQNSNRKIFESRVDQQYRLTWEYGKGDTIILRNVDNHDECLRNP